MTTQPNTSVLDDAACAIGALLCGSFGIGITRANTARSANPSGKCSISVQMQP
ncbi:MAG: hypothetical protein ACRYHA_34170 [Janthinobacterium lividum]